MKWIFWIEGDDGYTRYSNHVSDLPAPANIGGSGRIHGATLETFHKNRGGT